MTSLQKSRHQLVKESLLKNLTPKKDIVKKEDKKKFSKLLLAHCREYKREIPSEHFLDLLDDIANGKVTHEDLEGDLDDETTQEINWDELDQEADEIRHEEGHSEPHSKGKEPVVVEAPKQEAEKQGEGLHQPVHSLLLPAPKIGLRRKLY